MHPILVHIGALVIPSYGAVSALGVLLGLLLAARLARLAGVDADQVWNLYIVSLFAALVGTRLLLAAANWSIVRVYPQWLLGLAMIHHPLVTAVGAAVGGMVGLAYARAHKLPLRATADVLAAPLALALAIEEAGSLLAGSGYGTETHVRWAVIYTDPLTARWSGTPLGIPLHPVQAYAAVALLTLALFLCFWLRQKQREGDVAGLGLLGAGIAVFVTELWRDPAGRGRLLGGALDGPQAAAVALVLAGGLVLLEWKRRDEARHG